MSTFDAPDWLKVPGVGTGVPLTQGQRSVPTGTSWDSGPVYVGNQTLLLFGVFNALGPGPWTVTVTWLTGNDITKSTGNQFTWHTAGWNDTQVPLAVQAPWVRFQVGQSSGSTQTVWTEIYAVPAVVTRDLLVPTLVKIDQQAVALAGSATNTYYPDAPTVPGRYSLWTYSEQATFTAVQKLNAAGSWDIIREATIGGAALSARDGAYDFVAPADDWRVTVRNQTTTAATMFLGVTGPF